ncbi:MAG: rod shape-determining protein MreC [Elusimicrobia bacterium]|nr:rod shape-determining protein MreC [Elusimicrobiota bacterium]
MFKRNSTVILSFYLIISIVILSFNLNPVVKAARDFLFYVIISPYSKINTVLSSIGNLGGNIKDLTYAHQRLLELKNQNRQLLHDLLKLKTLEIENERLTRLLNYKRNIPRKTVIARIIAKPLQQYNKILIIDKGTASGLKENRPVYGFYKNNFGIVGQLRDVKENTSQVQVITNRISKIPARILPANVDGIIVGRESNRLEILWIPSSADIKIGDKVVTSSVSEIFPAGISIGIVVSVSQSGHLPFKSAKVEPIIPAFQLSDVFIE